MRTNTTQTDALARAIDYLGATDLGNGRYAIPASKTRLHKELGDCWLIVDERGVQTAMPPWWTPTQQTTFRCGCGKSPENRKQNFALNAHCLGKGFERITVDLTTGEESLLNEARSNAAYVDAAYARAKQ